MSKLINNYLDDKLSNDEIRELSLLLRSDSVSQQEFSAFIELHRDLEEFFANDQPLDLPTPNSDAII